MARTRSMSNRLQSGSWLKPRKIDAAGRHQEPASAERIRGRGNWRHRMVHHHARSDQAVRGSDGRSAVDSFRPRAGEKGVTLRRHDRSWVSYTFFAQPPYEGGDSSPRGRAPGSELRLESSAISRCSEGGFQDSCANWAPGTKGTL